VGLFAPLRDKVTSSAQSLVPPSGRPSQGSSLSILTEPHDELAPFRAGDIMISPLPVTLVEGRRRAQWCPPGTTDTPGARKAKVLHQVNQVVAQSKIRRHPVDRFNARHFDLRQDRCRSFGCPHRRRLLRMCCKRPCRSHASTKAAELAPPHVEHGASFPLGQGATNNDHRTRRPARSVSLTLSLPPGCFTPQVQEMR